MLPHISLSLTKYLEQPEKRIWFWKIKLMLVLQWKSC